MKWNIGITVLFVPLAVHAADEPATAPTAQSSPAPEISPVAAPAPEPAPTPTPTEPSHAHTGHTAPAKTEVEPEPTGHSIFAYTHLHHGHGEGMWMFEYRYMRMNMKGLLDGTETVRARDVALSNGAMTDPASGYDYMMAPTDMSMDMHMLMAMYDFTDTLTVMAMFNYLRNEMDMVMYMDGMTEPMSDMLPMESSGLGDTQVSLLYQATHSLSLGLGLNIPTGSIDEKGAMIEGGPKTRLPYTMQLGSGTYDVMPTVTYNADSGAWNWGGSGTATFRTGENDNDYRLGHRLEISGWLKYAFAERAVATSRLTYTQWGNVSGQDPEVDPFMSPDADPNNQGGIRTDLYLGVSAFKNGWIVSGELGAPIYQDLNGPQMKMESLIQLGVSYMLM